VTEKIEIDGHEIELSSLDKLMFPGAKVTKKDLIDYYRRIADTMLPHLKERPISMQRFPDGIEEGGFYQKEAPDYFPKWIQRVSIEVEEENTVQDQIICDNTATLVYLANYGCITLHTWLSCADKLHHPDKLIFDLDPPSQDFEPVRAAARALHHILEQVELPSYIMTTGSTGLHVAVPLDRSADFDTVRAFARDLAQVLADRHPDQFTTEVSKNKRKGRLFLDYLRNSYAQNGVAPYALRAKPGAPVATPLDWSELSDHSLHSQSYTIKNIFRRLGQKQDPWKDMMNDAQSLDDARDQLKKLQADEKSEE
jgi:bifunctional non-homologous end joining protein LigD